MYYMDCTDKILYEIKSNVKNEDHWLRMTIHKYSVMRFI